MIPMNGKLVAAAGLAACTLSPIAASTQAQEIATQAAVAVSVTETGQARNFTTGFAAADGWVIASIPRGRADYSVWTNADSLEAVRTNFDDAARLALLDVSGLSAPAFRVAQMPRAGDQVSGVALDMQSGVPRFRIVNGQIRDVNTSDNSLHVDLDGANLGSPVFNICNELVGIINEISGSSQQAVSAATMTERWQGYLTVESAGSRCLTPDERRDSAIQETQRVADSASTAADQAEARAAELTERLRLLIGAERADSISRDSLEAENARLKDVSGELIEELDDWRRAAQTRDSANADLRSKITGLQGQLEWADQRLWYVIGAAVVILALLGVIARRARRRAATAKKDADKAAAQVDFAQDMAGAAQRELDERQRHAQKVRAFPDVILEARGPKPMAVKVPGPLIARSEGCVVGRSPISSGVVIDDPKVSREHFRLSASGSGIAVEDLGSTNGTVLNGARLHPRTPTPLTEGSVLKVGGLTLKVRTKARAGRA